MHHSTRIVGPIEIRPASPSDAGAIVALGSDRTPRTAADAALFLARDDGGAFVARRGDAVIGAVWFVADGDVLRCFDLSVESASRNGGVGSALLAAIETEATRRGSTVVHIEAPLPGEGIAWLKRRGFALDASEPDVVDGVIATTVELTKIL